MRDWTGTQIQRDALVVPCAYCGAKASEPCHTKDDPGHVLQAFPAHVKRINEAKKAAK